jgi:uncharacterized protein
MNRAMRVVWAILLFLSTAPAWAGAPSFPDRARRAVVDAAAVIPDQAEVALDARIVAWNRATGHQLVVATVPSLQGLDVQDYGNRLLRHWRLGRTDIDDGVILLLAPSERQVRIEVGYGLESVLTDALTGVIVRDQIRPRLQAGDVAGALSAGAEQIMLAAARADGVAAQPPAPPARPFPWLKTILILIGLGFLILFLWPVFGLWYRVWPLYLIMPGLAKRAREKDDEFLTSALAAESARAEAVEAAGKRSKGKRKAAPASSAQSGSDDALESLRDRANAGSYDCHDSGGSHDSGFDSGGGSSGGGGASSDY